MTRRYAATAAFALGLAAFGVLSAVYFFAGDATYRDLMRDQGTVVFTLPDGAVLPTNVTGLVVFHRRTVAYVLGSAAELAEVGPGRPLFDTEERSHLADVRAIFAWVRVVWVAGGIALAGLIVLGQRQGWSMRMARDGSVAAGAVVLALGLVAAVAFEPAFLAFHRIFFPQGNFLFDPATSNLLRLYPEAYWYGITLRIGASFIAVAVMLALAAQAAMAGRRSRP